MRALRLTLVLNLLLAALFTAATTGSLLARPNDWAAVPLACFCFVWGMTWIITASWAKDSAHKLIDERASLRITNELLEAEANSANKELIRLYKENANLRYTTTASAWVDTLKEEPFWTKPKLTPEAEQWAMWVRGRIAAENFERTMTDVSDKLRRI